MNDKKRDRASGLILWIERIAAVMLGMTTVIIFVSALGRYVFATPVPDAFDLSRLTLAVAIIWGLASLGFRGNHIKVDLLSHMVRPSVRRYMDLTAWITLLIFTALLAWKIGERAWSQFPTGEVTMDLRIPHWPFLGIIVLGLIAAICTTTNRIWRIWRYNEGLDAFETIEGEPDE